MMKSKKKGKVKEGKNAKMNSAGKKANSYSRVGKISADDPKLTVREVKRINESVRNVKQGKYKDFTSVDEVWRYADSEQTAEPATNA